MSEGSCWVCPNCEALVPDDCDVCPECGYSEAVDDFVKEEMLDDADLEVKA
jgi:RNA polymerase subunit RPABC4/transcription elongation factor Spt4